MSSVIHSSAIVDSNACLADNCEVGPYAIIEEGSVIGSNCSIEAHAIVKKGTVLGKNVRVGHFSVLGGDPQHLAFDLDLFHQDGESDEDIWRRLLLKQVLN